MKVILSSCCVGALLVPGVSGFTLLNVFGDSLSDIGNTAEVARPEGYAPGRFSNGPVYVEQLGYPMRPSLEGGNNYAVGGARVRDGVGSLVAQIEAFQTRNPAGVPERTASILFIGGNDLRAAAMDPPNAQAMAGDALAGISEAILDLRGAGVSFILVPNLPDLSILPELNSATDFERQGVSVLTRFWNDSLQAMVDSFRAPEVQVFDTFTLFEEILADPMGFGFKTTGEPAISSPGDDEEFLFWDEVHPSAAMHRVLAQRIRETTPVPEPSFTLLFGMTLGLLGRRQRVQ